MPPFEASGNVELAGDNAAYTRSLLEGIARRIGTASGSPSRTGGWRPTASLWHDPSLVVRQGRSAGFAAFARQRLAHGRATAISAASTSRAPVTSSAWSPLRSCRC